MLTTLITGAFGNVGKSTVAACLAEGDKVEILEADTARNRKLAPSLLREWERLGPRPTITFGDVRDPELAMGLVARVNAVLHLAAVIPPAADRQPDLARSVNLGGTLNLIAACKTMPNPPRFVLASSIAAYGDRVDDFWIKVSDPLVSSPSDAYAQSKIEAEASLRSSGLPFVVLRLTAIMSRRKLQPDPLLFHMPLRTKIEICDTEDTGKAFAQAARRSGIEGLTFDIGGGASCRSDYRSFLDRMFSLIGLGGISRFPEEAFATSGFHCGWYADSDDAEAALGFRSKGLEDFYGEVASETKRIKPFAALVAPIVRLRMLAASPFLSARHSLAAAGA